MTNSKPITPDSSSELRSEIYKFADQITTLITKLHHKEIDFDLANSLSNQYQNAFMEVLAAHDNTLYQRVVEELPSKTNGEELNITKSATSLLGVDSRIVKTAQGEGWDQAIYEVETVLARIFGKGE